MALTKNAKLVEQAIQRRGGVAELTKSMSIAMDSYSDNKVDPSVKTLSRLV